MKDARLTFALTHSGRLVIKAEGVGRWVLGRSDTMEFARKLKAAIGKQASDGAVMNPLPADLFSEASLRPTDVVPLFIQLGDCDSFHFKPAAPAEEQVHRIACSRCFARSTILDNPPALTAGWKIVDGGYLCPRCCSRAPG